MYEFAQENSTLNLALFLRANLIGLYRVILRTFTRKRAIYLFRLSVVIALADRCSVCLFDTTRKSRETSDRFVLCLWIEFWYATGLHLVIHVDTQEKTIEKRSLIFKVVLDVYPEHERITHTNNNFLAYSWNSRNVLTIGENHEWKTTWETIQREQRDYTVDRFECNRCKYEIKKREKNSRGDIKGCSTSFGQPLFGKYYHHYHW